MSHAQTHVMGKATQGKRVIALVNLKSNLLAIGAVKNLRRVTI
ncbi:MAG: hypothetical protein ACI9MN_001485 [Saprospiraceae bacterium]|jgi:hypothetical protein